MNRDAFKRTPAPLIARRYAFVDPSRNPGHVHNYWGMPPGLMPGTPEPVDMPNPSLVVIASDGVHAFVLGFAADGTPLADS